MTTIPAAVEMMANPRKKRHAAAVNTAEPTCGEGTDAGEMSEQQMADVAAPGQPGAQRIEGKQAVPGNDEFWPTYN